MNNRDLDELLRSYADKPVPTPPGNLEDAVWREIRLRRETPVRESFVELVGRLRLARAIPRLFPCSLLWH